MPQSDNHKIAIIESDQEKRNYLRSLVSDWGYRSFCFDKETTCVDNLDPLDPGLIIIGSLSLVRMIRFLGAIREKNCRLPILIIFYDENIQTFVDENKFSNVTMLAGETKSDSLKRGMLKFFANTFKADSNKDFGIVGSSPAIVLLKKMVQELRRSTEAVIIQGESGTGKETFARAIHNSSERNQNAFIKVDGKSLAQSFPKADYLSKRFRNGGKKHNIAWEIFESAHCGTVFFQEICDIPVEIQAELLGFVSNRANAVTSPFSANRFDVRVLASSTKNLDLMVQQGEFRKDLYYRLNVIRMDVPPLRQRREDIILLADFFARQFYQKLNKPVVDISEKVKGVFLRYHWPGNVRELENIIKRYVVSNNDKAILAYFPEVKTDLRQQELLDIGNACADIYKFAEVPDVKTYIDNLDGRSLKNITDDFVERIERKIMKKALEITNWNRKRAAHILDISYKSLLNKIKAYKIA